MSVPAVVRWLPPTRWSYALAFATCAALLAAALYIQYGLGLEPCPLCIFQRIVFIGMGVVFLVAALHNPGPLAMKVYAGILGLLGAAGIALAVRHLYIQSLPPGSVPACGMGLDYMLQAMPLNEVVMKVLHGGGECAKVDRVLGLSIPTWTLLMFAGLTLLPFALIWRRRRASPPGASR